MKKILFIIFLSLFCTVSFAQTEHMKFKGIPLTGPLMSFVNALKAKGYVYYGTEDGIACLKGEFAATKDCTIGVATYQGKDQVNSVVVIFPKKDYWTEVSDDYFSLKSLLTEKYGEPKCVEKFTGDEPYSDGIKMDEINSGHCNYVSNSKLQMAGQIIINKSDGFVRLQ